ncbi:MAG: CinA family protein [Clostridia bacterium]|nr:CinA family protein [Clostridia bacterium]
MKKLEESVVKLLTEKNLTVAFAESCTGGLVAKRITDVSGASQVFCCGVVSYSNEVKVKVLGVDSEIIKQNGAVDSEVAKQMALGVRKIVGDDIGIGITGIAGPDPSENGKPAGLIYIALAYEDKVNCTKLTTGCSDRDKNRLSASDCALEMILKEVR